MNEDLFFFFIYLSMNNEKFREINRLNFEDILWFIFIGLSILNIVSNNLQKEYVISEEQIYEKKANNISIKVLTTLVFVYLYFFIRNYNMYRNKENATDTDLVKVIGSLLFVIGAICLLYFQVNSDDNFIGGPAI